MPRKFELFIVLLKGGLRARDLNLKELRLWPRLHHGNVLEFYGYITPRESSEIRTFGLPIVSKLMVNGTAINFVKCNPACNIVSIVC